LIGYSAYYLYTQPIKNILIKGNYLVNDAEIIRAARIENYPSFLGFSRNSAETRLNNLTLVESVKISRDLRFRLTIEVLEARPVFLYNTNRQLMLSNGEFTDNTHEFLGIPTLINFAPEVVLQGLTTKLRDIDPAVLHLISEFEYAPLFSESGMVIDETRFILYMNDGNEVHININRGRNLNRYPEIFASLGSVQGIIYLDSRQNAYFEPFGTRDVQTTSS
jgi:cell division septal protein FtsQ